MRRALPECGAHEERVVTAKQDVVAVFNSNPDMVAMLRFALERAGFIVVIGHVHDVRNGMLDLPDYIRQHQPRVIVYDVVMPYDRNWNFMAHLRDSDAMDGRHFVLTAPNASALHAVVGTNERVYEIVDEGDLDAVVQAVREAAKSRAVR
jgi:DNA-binding NarL/FixJ family response regulator